MEDTEFRGILAHGFSSKPNKKLSKTANKCKISNEDRLANLRKLHQSALNRDKLISDSLKNIDQGDHSLNKRIKFDLDDESSDAQLKNDQKSPASKSPTKSSRKLFDDDNDSDTSDINSFVVPPKFEGKAGVKLMTLQSKFSGDARFKMNERFLDDFKTEELDNADNNHIDNPVVEKPEEFNKQIDILQKVLGRPVVQTFLPEDSGREKFKPRSLIVRYDPTNPTHHKYRRDIDSQDAGSGGGAVNLHKKVPSLCSSSDSDDSDKEEKMLPEKPEIHPKRVSRDNTKKEYKMDPEFADRLRKTVSKSAHENPSAPPGFSVLAMLGRQEPQPKLDTAKDKNVIENSTLLDNGKSNVCPDWQLKLLGKKRSRRSSSSSQGSDHDDTEDRKHGDLIIDKNKSNFEEQTEKDVERSLSTRFFFYPDDPRLKEPHSFYRTKSMETVRKQWKKNVEFLVKVYKKRRKEAVRNLKKKSKGIITENGKSDNKKNKKRSSFKQNKSKFRNNNTKK